jgi:REP element-mobilizing transposase RayT
MPRLARLHVSGGLYHVTLRGNHRQPIFHRESDPVTLESFVADALARHAARAHAYCWMPNHVHLLVQVTEDPLGRVMQRIGTRYARFVQRRLDTTGHFFERRYYAILVDSEQYLLTLVRYIHLNPVRAGLVAEAADYRWSSHRCYLGLESRPWLDTEAALGRFAADLTTARADYVAYVATAQGWPTPSPLVDGAAVDKRVLGGDEFLTRLPAPAPAVRPMTTLDGLIESACAEFAVDPQDLSSASRSHALSHVRTMILQRALEARVATCSEVARRFGRSAAALSQSLERARRMAAARRNAGVAPAPAPCVALSKTFKR